MFERPHHKRIQKLLEALNPEFLQENECLFGGGTAIVLLLNEYRESLDVDFLCASHDGYRTIRNSVTNRSLGEILRSPLNLVREVRADRYGIRTFIEIDGQPAKFEIVREDRITLCGEIDDRIGMPILSKVDMYAEKLLANADRYLDGSALSRDIIDLAMMIKEWGPIPAEAWEKACGAYGESVEKAFAGALAIVGDSGRLHYCMSRMEMPPDLEGPILEALAKQSPSARIQQKC